MVYFPQSLTELEHNSVVIKALSRMSETTIRLAILLLLGVQDGLRVCNNQLNKLNWNSFDANIYLMLVTHLIYE